jgi:PAS domain S-box-containing protein
LNVHPVLRRQLSRLDLVADQPPSPAAWQSLLERIGATYRTADEDRYTLERSLDLSSREMTMLNEETRHRLREMETLLAVSQVIGDDVPLPEMLRRVARATAQSLGADMVGAYTSDADHNCLRAVAGYHVPPALLESFRTHPIPLRGHPAVEAMWHGQRAIYSSDAANDGRFQEQILDRWPARSLLFSPMIVDGAPLGALVAVWWRDAHTFTTTELRIADGVGRQAAMAVKHRQARGDLARAHAQTEQLLASIEWILIAVDSDGRITRWNAAAEQAFGVRRDAAVGRPVDEVPIAWRWDVVRGCLANQPSARLDDVRYRRPDGTDGYLAGRVTALPDGGEAGSGFVVLGLDVSERRILEAQLAQAQKLESIGQLAAGVAHEINTPIQFVGDNVRFLQQAFDDLSGLLGAYGRLRDAAAGGPVAERVLEEVAEREIEADLPYLIEEVPAASRQTLDGVNRVASIVRALKEFAHPDQTERVATDLNRALLSTLTVARNEVKYVADVETDLGDLPPVVCQAGELNQVFLNIVVNAAHAIADVVGTSGTRGRISIRTRAAGDTVCIAIQDTGGGIPDTVQGRIFDPFFTTKPVGRGTGQGLALARAFVQKHGGSLTFACEAGQGTTFFVRLPVDGRCTGA